MQFSGAMFMRICPGPMFKISSFLNNPQNDEGTLKQ